MLKNKAENRLEKSLRIKKLKKTLDSLKTSVKKIDIPETGINFSTLNVACDLIPIIQFSKLENLQKYIENPEHRKVAE